MQDLIILGAGVSGLATAWSLRNSDLDLTIVEARDQIGGRTRSFSEGANRFDLGASWVWDHERAVHRLIDALGIPSFPSHEDGVDMFERARGSVQTGRLPRAWSASRRIDGGTETIARTLAEAVSTVPLTLGRIARRIAAHDDRIEVTFDDGSALSARDVVAAYPPTLVAPQLEADPAIQRMLEETPIWMADVAKAVIVYDRAFWRSLGHSGRVLSHVGPMVEVHDLSGRTDADGVALFGFIPRDGRLLDGTPIKDASEDDLADAVVDQLVRLFGDDAANPRAIRVQAWWREPFTGPAESPPPRPELFGHRALREPLLDGRLHLISTETAAENTGHIDGAVRRAFDVAETLLSKRRT